MAKAGGVRTDVFVSSAGIRGALAGYAPYCQMKVGVEEAIRGLGFDRAVILRPGMILGREQPKAAFFEALVGSLNKLGQGLQDAIGKPRFPPLLVRDCELGGAASATDTPSATPGQDQTVIGRAAVAAARIAEEGKAPEKFWVVEQADIVRLGRTEWKE